MWIFFVFAAIAAAIGYAISRNPYVTGINAVFAFLWGYLTLPTLKLDHIAPYAFLFMVLLIPVWLTSTLFRDPSGPSKAFVRTGAGTAVFGILALIVAPFLTSFGWFHQDSYRNLLGDVEKVDKTALTDELEVFDQKQARFVDQGLAANRAEELLGKKAGLASRVTIAKDKMAIQQVDGRLTWVGPLSHSGLKGLYNDTTPGFVTVDQTNRSDARIDLDREMNCMPSEFFAGDLDRAVYQAGYMTTAYTEPTLEINADGDPRWVYSTYDHRVGFMGSDPTGVLVVNPETCAVTQHGIDNAPEWIDRIYPWDMLNTQVADWGEYVNGFWNKLFAERDVITSTDKMYLLREGDGDVVWYTGMTSSQTDRGTQGIMIVDARTKDATYYQFAGVTESGMQEALLGKVAEKTGWSASNPIPYNVNGTLTGISVLKDKNENPQKIGLVSVQNRQLVAIGDTPRQALRNYMAELRASGQNKEIDGKGQERLIEGIVQRIGHEVLSGNSGYYLKMRDIPGAVFRAPASLGPEVALTESGDRVEMRIYDSSGPEVEVVEFDNQAVELDAEEARKAVREALNQDGS